jgi:hypothetical protein
MTDEERNEADLRWCDHVSASVVDELLIAKLITADQATWVREIVAQDIHIQLVSGLRPPNSN